MAEIPNRRIDWRQLECCSPCWWSFACLAFEEEKRCCYVAAPAPPPLPAWPSPNTCLLLGNPLTADQHHKGVWSGEIDMMGLLPMWWWKDVLHWFCVAGSFLPLQSEGLEFWPANHLEVLFDHIFLMLICSLYGQQTIWRYYMIIFLIVNLFNGLSF